MVVFRSFNVSGSGKWNVEVNGSVHLKMRTKIEEDSAMATYSIDDLSRREILKMSAILGVTSVVSAKFAFAQAALQRTPGQILGPFYPMKSFGQNADLTKVPGRPGRAEGEILNVMGRVLNLKGEPVRNATIEVWQANAHGRYTHPSDTNPAPLDPNFEGSAVLTTDRKVDIGSRLLNRRRILPVPTQSGQRTFTSKFMASKIDL